MRELRTTVLHILVACLPIGLIQWPPAKEYLLEKREFIDFLFYLPYFFFVVTLGLAHLLNQTRIVFTAVYFILAYYLIVHLNGLTPDIALLLPIAHRMTALSIATPITIGLLFLFNEGRLLSKDSALKLAVSFLPLAFALFSVYGQPPEFRLGMNWLSFPGLPFWILPQVSIIFIMLYLAICVFFRDPYIRSFNFSLAFSLVPFYFALNLLMDIDTVSVNYNLIAGVSFTFLGLILIMSMIRLSWQKIYLDELTQIPNRRALNEALKNMGKEYSVAMIDIDNFKKFNDVYGHSEGDNALRYVARHFDRELKGRVYRYGGEEFCVLMRRAKTADASKKLDKIRKKLASQLFYIRSSAMVKANKNGKVSNESKKRRLKPRKLHITVSIGVAQKKKLHRQAEEVLKSADEALYAAKENGRNCVVIA